jgi:hypothetical protein
MGFGNVMNFRNEGIRKAFERRAKAGLAAIGQEIQLEWQGIDPEEHDIIVYCGGLSVTESANLPGVFIVEAFAPTPATRWEPEGGDPYEVGRANNATEAAALFASLYARHLVDAAIEASDEASYAEELAAEASLCP